MVEAVEVSGDQDVAKLQRRLSEHKSFEMEDIPSSDNPILGHSNQMGQKRRSELSFAIGCTLENFSSFMTA